MKELGELENRPLERFRYPLFDGCEDHYVHKSQDVLMRIVLQVFDQLGTRQKFWPPGGGMPAWSGRTARPCWMPPASMGAWGGWRRPGRCFQRYYEESTAADLAWEYGGEPMERSLALRRRHYTEDLAERLGLPLRRLADKDLYFNCAE